MGHGYMDEDLPCSPPSGGGLTTSTCFTPSSGGHFGLLTITFSTTELCLELSSEGGHVTLSLRLSLDIFK
ncbi:hypothetical protein GDO81_017445 [Engystomops pustulosus]|uniref:Uncharacterized protein n=1 Tax=Engystomops pustulosus TaxID=76066 RepID=A0AAV7AJY7_ENGPU|nr:hypothetical protein GDO81_017445 [Engystomops pustulosus]